MSLFAIQDAYIRAGFGEREFHNSTNLNPVGAVVLVSAVLAVLLLSRRHALWPLLAMSSAVPTGQRVAVLTLDFNLIRLVLLAYGVRILIRGERLASRLTLTDRLLIGWLACRICAYTALHGTTGAFVYQAGQLYDFLGIYFVARVYMRTPTEVRTTWNRLAMVSLPVALLFLVEMNTARNLFSAMGGVPEFTAIRDGRLRCQGPYEHPILAGAFWAMLLPVFAGLARTRTRSLRTAGRIGLACSLLIIFACASSTPLIGVVVGLGLAAALPIRSWAPQGLLMLAGALLVIHFIREPPVWQLIAKAGVVGGSTAIYRYRLLDAFIRNWSEWLIIGTKGTAHWGFYLFDLTNQYVVEGVRGGLVTLALFLAGLASGIRTAYRSSISRVLQSRDRMLSWHAVAALGGTAVMFIGISITHSNQTTMIMLLLLASTQTRRGAAKPVSSKSSHSEPGAKPVIPHP